MRDLELEHEEIDLIKDALFYVYYKKLKILKKNSKILSDAACKKITHSANRYYDLAEKIENGDCDV